MLTSRITVPPPPNPEVEDIFSSSLSTLFTDDTQNSHGTPGGLVIYTSPQFGPLTLRIPAHPDHDASRRLFAHYLWNAAVVAADLLEAGSLHSNPSSTTNLYDDPFNITHKSILELGAGTALPSVICALSGARSVLITDHPTSPSITTDAIAANVQSNLFPEGKAARSPMATVDVRGYVWGEETFWSASKFGVPAPTDGSGGNESFDRILMCDCLWIPSQHRYLVSSAERWLNGDPSSCAIVVAGFHTGRGIVGDFFDVAAGEDVDGRGGRGPLAIAEIYEVDVHGERREWARERAEENRDQAKRWCVVGILKKRKWQ